MSDKKNLFKNSRWNDTDHGITIGHENTTYENELNGLNEMMKSGLFDDNWYQKNLKIFHTCTLHKYKTKFPQLL